MIYQSHREVPTALSWRIVDLNHIMWGPAVERFVDTEDGTSGSGRSLRSEIRKVPSSLRMLLESSRHLDKQNLILMEIKLLGSRLQCIKRFFFTSFRARFTLLVERSLCLELYGCSSNRSTLGTRTWSGRWMCMLQQRPRGVVERV